MGKDEFLRLLVSQISNQDPLNPLQGHEFAAQLAQFSSVEQLLNISDVLKTNGEFNAMLAQSMNNGVAAGLIGKEVATTGNQISWTGEGTADMNFKLAKPAASVTITIRDSLGNVVRKMELEGRSDGDHTITWDGLDRSAAHVKPGIYRYEIDAKNAKGETVAATPTFRGRVDRIAFGQEGIQLWIGKVPIAMSQVESVFE